MQYRKKPIVIEAFQFGVDTWTDWFFNAHNEGIVSVQPNHQCDRETDIWCTIETIDGTMIAHVGDYIIKGVKGELYPCKADIFQLTYELLEEEDITYVYRLRNGEGLYANSGLYTWSTPGKLWSGSGHLKNALLSCRHVAASALRKEIELEIQQEYGVGPRDSWKWESKEQKEFYHRFDKRFTREYIAAHLPEDWIVECIPSALNGERKEIPAREFYMTFKKQSAKEKAMKQARATIKKG